MECEREYYNCLANEKGKAAALRGRMHLTRKRAELLAHIQNTNYQYNLPDIEKKVAYKANRQGVAERFPDESVKKSIQLDLKLLDYYD